MNILPALLAAMVLAAPSLARADDDTPPDHASPSVCVVILGLMQQAIADGQAKGDAKALQAASKALRREAVRLEGGEDEANQMIGSSVSFYDELTVKQLSKSSAMCVAARNQRFTEDE